PGTRPCAQSLPGPVFPPWPFTTSTRAKPWPSSESATSERTASSVDVRNVGLPGYAVRRHRQDRHAERLGRFGGRPLGEDVVGFEREVGVLLGRAHREDDPVVA